MGKVAMLKIYVGFFSPKNSKTYFYKLKTVLQTQKTKLRCSVIRELHCELIFYPSMQVDTCHI